ncbi:MBL fold metallo-hydrolase [Novosphingobium terrae]|uniref:MBL fold metallo-hydrolase n=1 Tax=Novosphingobium terrae TaxID=2726189 RepID=UPI00197D87DC|nr:MBL fold metallo-hydrolase [Novosphingobium terrae]
MALATGIALLAMVTGFEAQAQQRPGPLTLTPHKIASGVYWVEGGTSNTGFAVGTTGVVAIDAQQTAEAVQAVQAEIAKITPRRVDTLIITHSDPDHVGGIPSYPPATQIIEQENTRATILATAADTSGAPPMVALYKQLAKAPNPTRLVADSEHATIDGLRVELIHVAPGHSAGDLIIYLPDQKVVFAGDVVTTNTGQFPVIHLGGSSLGWIAAMKAILALDARVIVPGHGAVESREQLTARLKAAEQRRDAVKAMIAQGKSLDEIKQALPETGGNPMFPGFDETTYNELTKGYPGTAVAPWHNIIHRP